MEREKERETEKKRGSEKIVTSIVCRILSILWHSLGKMVKLHVERNIKDIRSALKHTILCFPHKKVQSTSELLRAFS